MRIPGRKKVRQAARWARSRVGQRALILGYHRVADAPRDPWDMIVSPARFDEHLQVLRECARPLDLGSLVEGLSAGLPDRAVALTFDDGYVDLGRHARPLLERHGIPATVFVIAGELGRTPWWDRLASAVLDGPLPATLELEVEGRPFRWTAADGEPRALLDALYERVRGRPAAVVEALLEQLAGLATRKASAVPLPRLMDADEVRELSDGGPVRIGAHTLSHPPLGRLDAAAQRSEIEGSRRRLEEIVEGPVSAFSYPHGSTSVETAGLVREAGFTSACASVNNVARPGTDPYFLPRFWIGDWDGDVFRRWLVRWL